MTTKNQRMADFYTNMGIEQSRNAQITAAAVEVPEASEYYHLAAAYSAMVVMIAEALER